MHYTLMRELSGFFLADGYLGITTNGFRPNGSRYYIPRAIIIARDDALDTLRVFHRELGGELYRIPHRPPTRPCIAWRLRRRDQMKRICALLRGTTLPHPKLTQVPIMEEFLALSGIKGDEAQAQRAVLHERMKRAHLYLVHPDLAETEWSHKVNPSTEHPALLARLNEAGAMR